MIRTIATMLALLCLPAAADEIDDFCRDRWGVDYVMRDYCIKEQRAARARVINSSSGAQNASPEAELEARRYAAIMEWLRQRNIWRASQDEIAALSRSNADAAHYVDCEGRARRNDDGTSRFKRILDCLAE